MTKNLYKAAMTALLIAAASPANGQEAKPPPAPAMEDSLQQARMHFSFAVQYKNNGEFEQAVEQYRESIAWADTLFQVHYSFADMLLDMGRESEARGELLRTLELNPRHHKSASLLAELYHAESEYDSTLVMYEIMHEIEPDMQLLDTIAGLKAYLGDIEGAFAANRTLIAAGDASAERLGLAADYGYAIGELTLADAYIRGALAQEPENTTYLRLAARISVRRDMMDRALPYLLTLADREPPDTWAILKIESYARETGDTGLLVRALDRLHAFAPEDSAVTGELAESLYRLERYSEAADVAREGLEISPGDGRLHIILGEYHRNTGDTGRALAEYRAALVDSSWSESARQFIMLIEQPETSEEQAEREFFNRGRNDLDNLNNTE